MWHRDFLGVQSSCLIPRSPCITLHIFSLHTWCIPCQVTFSIRSLMTDFMNHTSMFVRCFVPSANSYHNNFVSPSNKMSNANLKLRYFVVECASIKKYWTKDISGEHFCFHSFWDLVFAVIPIWLPVKTQSNIFQSALSSAIFSHIKTRNLQLPNSPIYPSIRSTQEQVPLSSSNSLVGTKTQSFKSPHWNQELRKDRFSWSIYFRPPTNNFPQQGNQIISQRIKVDFPKYPTTQTCMKFY